MDHLPVRRIHISSDFKVPGGTHSDFLIRLSQSVSLPDDTVAFVDNITVENTFYTIQSGNDLLYVAEKLSSAVVLCRTIQLAHGNYNGVSYATELTNKLNIGHTGLLGTNPYSAVYSQQEGVLTVTTNSGYNFTLMNDLQIAAHDGSGGLLVDKGNPRSGNRVIRNTVGDGNANSNPINYNFALTLKTGFLALLGVKQIFVHSNLSDHAVMGCRGLSDIICCIPVSASFSQTIHHNMTSQADAINVSKRSFDTLSFQLRDAFGNILESNEGSFSCSLIFMQKI